MTIKRKKKPMNIEKKVSNIIAKYADIDSQFKALTEQKELLKETILDLSEEMEVNSFSSEVGSLSISRSSKPTESFDKKKAQSFLTIEQWKSCIKYGNPRKPTVTFRRQK